MKSTVVCHGPKPSFEMKTKRILQSNKAVWVAEYSWWSNISGLLYVCCLSSCISKILRGARKSLEGAKPLYSPLKYAYEWSLLVDLFTLKNAELSCHNPPLRGYPPPLYVTGFERTHLPRTQQDVLTFNHHTIAVHTS